VAPAAPLPTYDTRLLGTWTAGVYTDFPYQGASQKIPMMDLVHFEANKMYIGKRCNYQTTVLEAVAGSPALLKTGSVVISQPNSDAKQLQNGAYCYSFIPAGEYKFELKGDDQLLIAAPNGQAVQMFRYKPTPVNPISPSAMVGPAPGPGLSAGPAGMPGAIPGTVSPGDMGMPSAGMPYPAGR
jgi:hypothetical protein